MAGTALRTRGSAVSAEPGALPRRRWPWAVALVLGLGLALAPVAFGMFDRAPQGARMIAEFRPFMSEQRLDGYVADVAEVRAAVHETDTTATQRLGAAQVRSGAYADLSRQWPQIDAEMSRLLTTVRGNVGTYRDVAALPSFRLFPWFFVVPGVLIAGVAAAGLARRLSRRTTTGALAVLGVGLVLAPVAFQMFTCAPSGGRMMTAFRQLETHAEVGRIQDYFGTMASGQGDLRLRIAPALDRAGTAAADVPAITALDRDWVRILNDLTPMIGAMSDNVGSYAAVAALPPFPLFPWFFVVPGVLVVGLAVAGARRPRPTHRIDLEGAS